MEKKDLLKYCLLYKGQASIEDNPLKKENDCFKWYMWRVEYVTIQAAIKEKVTKDNLEVFFNENIVAGIDLYADKPFGGNPKPYYNKYIDYKE